MNELDKHLQEITGFDDNAFKRFKEGKSDVLMTIKEESGFGDLK